MNTAWTLDIDEHWVAWLSFDRPEEKVNVLNSATMHELEERLDEVARNESIAALVIRSGKDGSFVAGADIDELADIKDAKDAQGKAEAGHRIFGTIASLSIPTVAVVHGACLGGGLELALACDYRLATDDAKTSLGLPEVNLGIIPGWGGTQRLPRLIGLAPALQMIMTGKPVPGRKAYKLGLADGVLAGAFQEEQTRRFLERIGDRRGRRAVLRRRQKAQSRTMRWMAATPMGRALIYRQSRKQVVKRTKGHYPAPLEALDVVRRTFRKGTLSAGLVIEADTFARLVGTPVSRNLIHLFQASQRLKKSGRGGADSEGQTARTAGVVGGGIMGSGIAWAFSRAGLQVRLQEINWEAAARGMASASNMFRALVDRRKMTKGQMNLAMHRICPTTEYHGFRSADVVVEAVVEDLDLKRRVLREIESRVGPDTIIATNTSSLPLNQLAGALKNPKRFVGLHFFNPVNRMPLVEVIPCRKTSTKTINAAVQMVRHLGKTPIVVGDCAGFLVNRILLPYLVESAWMYEEGVEARRIDGLLEQFGMPMGPITLADEVGLDVGYKVAKVLESAYGQRMHVPTVLGAIAESGELLGKKSGSGFYVYGRRHKKPNPQAARLVTDARRQDDVLVTELSDEQIIDRAVLIMVNEAARCLDEKIVEDAEALDMAMVMGTGFAPFRGGLLRYADERGVADIADHLSRFSAVYGDRFEPAPLLARLAKDGGQFHRAPAA